MPAPGYVFRDSGTTPPANEQSLRDYLGQHGESTVPVQHDGYTTGAQSHTTGTTTNRNNVVTNGKTTPANTNKPLPPTAPGITVHDTTHDTHTLGQGKVADLKARTAIFKDQVVNELDPDSHDIARRSLDQGGAVQTHPGSNDGIRDIGWHRKNYEIPDPLIGDLPNGQLFARIRRFNKVHISSCQT